MAEKVTIIEIQTSATFANISQWWTLNEMMERKSLEFISHWLVGGGGGGGRREKERGLLAERDHAGQSVPWPPPSW